MAEIKPAIETFAKIKVIGVGGSGTQAVNRMIQAKIRGVDFVALNTDVQALHHSQAPTKIHIGKTVTRGLGAGMDPDVGRRAAEENQNDIRDILKGADMVFVVCGLGGGTGSGAAPVVAELARDMGALTIGVVTMPFSFEGAQRMQIAEEAFSELSPKVDSIISIPNDKLLSMIDKKTSLIDSFGFVDEVIKSGVAGISELITVPGLINVDYADVKSIMQNTGSALMGIGKASGDNRAAEAAKAAVQSPLLDISIEGARGILFIVTGGPNLTLNEVNEAAKIITGSADESAKIIFGAVIDESLKDELRITVVATGFSGDTFPIQNTAQTSEPEESFGSTIGNIFSASKDDAIPEETIQPSSARKLPRDMKENTEVVSDEKDTEAEELEIPAFIRKKMNEKKK